MICEFIGCQNEIAKGKHTRFCSYKCANLYRWGATSKKGKDIVKICVVCGKEWHTVRSNDNNQRRTCSEECDFAARSRAHKGKIVSQETRKKLSESRLGVPLSDEHRKAISDGQRGEFNCRWIDGRSLEKSPKDYNFEFTTYLKTSVKKRDNYKCTKCSHDGSVFLLFVHHIDHNKMNNNLSNLTTLCSSCHSKHHWESHTFDGRNKKE